MLFSFKSSELKPLIEHARNAKEHRGIADTDLGPGLFIVHDEGVYLMSNGLPPLPDPEKPDSPGSSRVVYARGWGEKSHLPGDDFGEYIPLADLERIDEFEDVEIELTGEHLTMRLQ